MKKKETSFSLLFRHWIKAKPFIHSCTFELKHTRGKDYFNFSEFTEEQENWAYAITNGNILMRNQGGSGEPDYTYHVKQPTYIAIRYPEGFVVILVSSFVRERDNGGEKSLSWSRAKRIAMYTVKM
jgi:hypothetical protein